jgi:hypothetical protein
MTKSTRQLAEALTAQGHPVSDDTVGRLLKQQGYTLQQPQGAAADLVDQPGAGGLGAGVGGQQRNILVVVGAAVLVGGHADDPSGGPVRMGRADLLAVVLPVGPVPAGQLSQRSAAGLVPHLGRGAVGRQLDASLLPVLVVLVGVAAGQLRQRPVAAGAVGAAVLPLAAAGLALAGAPAAALAVEVEQLHPPGLAAVVAHLVNITGTPGSPEALRLRLRLRVLSEQEAVGAAGPLLGSHGHQPVRGDQLMQQAVQVRRGGIAAEPRKFGPWDHLGVGLGKDVDDERLGGKRQLLVMQHQVQQLRFERGRWHGGRDVGGMVMAASLLSRRQVTWSTAMFFRRDI